MDVSMIFGIIFTIVVIGLVLIFGSGALQDLFCFGSDAQIIKEIKNIEKKVEDIYYLAENSGETHTISIPSSQKICFFNSSDPSPRYTDSLHTWNPDSAYQRIIKNEGYNVWYYSGCRQNGYTIPKLDLPANKNFCAPGGSKIYILKKWDWVEIEPA